MPAGVLVLLAAAILLGGGAAAQSGPEDDTAWQFVTRAILESGENQTHTVTVWTDAEHPDRIALDPPPAFLFTLSTGPNATTVNQGPPLRLEGWPCDAACAATRPEDSGFLALLRDGADGLVDGTYTWRPELERTFDEPGTWRMLIAFNGAPLGSGAGVSLDLIERDPAGSAWQDRLLAFEELLDEPWGRALVFIGLLVLFIGIAKVGSHIARRTVLSPQRVDPTIGRLAVRLGSVVFLLVGLALALWVVWDLNFWAGLTTLGLLSVALGFGMQNTVANMMGGINLAVDRPFVLGDRVQVGDTWGDVQEIGLRSTRILTTKHEVVIIPNKLLDEREIWNYTIQHPEMRVDVDVVVSYDSDRRLAEALMLQAAAGHEDVLAYPRPRVLLQNLGDNGLELQLRAWIPGATDARPIASRIRKHIFDLFQEHGVSIPFPHRTLVEHKALPPPHRASEEELDALAVRDPRLPKMVYATAGPQPIRATAEFIARVSAELDLAMVVLHVTRSGDPRHRKMAARVLDTFRDAGAHEGVAVETVERTGDVTEAIRDVVEEHNADLLAIGSSRQSLVPSPRHLADLTRRIRDTVDVPVLIVPRNLRLNARTLQHYGKLIAARQKERQQRAERNVDASADPEEAHEDEPTPGGHGPNVDETPRQAREDREGEDRET